MVEVAPSVTHAPRYRLLGPVEVVVDARPAELGGPKQRAVLALLVLEAGRVVSSDRLVDAVWGDDHPTSATASVQAYISNLRRVLRDDERATSPIVRRGQGYVIEVAADDVDLACFSAECAAAQHAVDDADWAEAVAAAQRAETLWRGPLLAEFADEEWVRIAASTAGEQRAHCAENLVVGLLGLDRVGDALVRARRLADEQPLSERACWLHAVALHRAGRAADALDTLQSFTRRMDDELGLEIGPALRDVQGAILRQDAALARWPARRGSPPGTPPVVEPDPPAVEAGIAPASNLVGRVRELAEAGAVLSGVGDGLRWVVLSGPAGIGKSRLTEEIVAAWQSRGGRVARAGCPDDDGVPAWWPVRQLLRSLDEDPDALLTPPAGVDADAARFAAYDSVARALLRAVSDGPLLLVVEDVHWADPTSLRLLTHLAGAGAATLAGLGVVVTARDDEGGADLERLLATVVRRAGSRRLTLPPLTAAEVGALAHQITGESVDDRAAEQLRQRTGGNPFFVSEYARLSDDERDELPAAVRSVLGRRLSALDPDVLQVLRTAALLGDTLEIDLLATVTRLDRDELADRLDEAADEHVIVTAPGSGGYVFSHALLRDEVLAGLTPVRRQRLHLRVAEALGDRDDTDRVVRRAAHLVAAQPLAAAGAVFAACRAAALDAERRWEPDSAARWWEHAIGAFDRLAEPVDVDRDDLVVAQVSALARAGRGQTVLDVIAAALLDAVRRDRLDSVGRLAATLLRTSGSWPWAAYGSDPGPLLTRLGAVESLVDDNPVAHVRVLAALAVGSCYDPDAHVPDGLSARAIELAESIDPATPERDDALADALLGRALTFSGVAERAAESVALLDRLSSVEHRLQQVDEIIGHGLGFLARMALGDAQAAAEHARFGALGSDLLRLATSRVQFRWAEGTLTLLRGDLAGAERQYQRAVELHAQTELYQTGVHDIARFSVLWERGRLQRSDFAGVDLQFLPWAAPVLAVAAGDPAAVDLLAAEINRREPPRWTTHARLTLLAHAVVDAGAAHLAPALIDRLRPLAGCLANVGQCGFVGPVGVALARLQLLVGDRAGARDSVERARGVATRAQAEIALLRCRAVRAQLDGAGPAEWSAIADEARRRGLLGLLADAEAAVADIGAGSQRQ